MNAQLLCFAQHFIQIGQIFCHQPVRLVVLGDVDMFDLVIGRVKIFVGLVLPMLAIAAVIEAYITPVLLAANVIK